MNKKVAASQDSLGEAVDSILMGLAESFDSILTSPVLRTWSREVSWVVKRRAERPPATTRHLVDMAQKPEPRYGYRVEPWFPREDLHSIAVHSKSCFGRCRCSGHPAYGSRVAPLVPVTIAAGLRPIHCLPLTFVVVDSNDTRRTVYIEVYDPDEVSSQIPSSHDSEYM